MDDISEKTVISAQVPVPLRNELARLARHHDLSISDEIRRAVRLHLRVEASPPLMDAGGVAPPAAPPSAPREEVE
jgi:hypothetical protein